MKTRKVMWMAVGLFLAVALFVQDVGVALADGGGGC